MPEQNSNEITQINANANSIPNESMDCGITRLKWCQGASCLKYARLRTFILILVVTGILQGACETYFRVSAKQAASENGYNPLIVDWLLVSSGLFQAIFALFFAYWAHRIHPTSWLGGVIMLQGVVCIISVIPSIINFSEGVPLSNSSREDIYCSSINSVALQSTLSGEQSHILTLVMLFVLQLLLGLGSLAFYTIGIVYLDDNSPSIDSPAAIAAVMAAKIFGLQAGSFLVIGIGFASLGKSSSWWLGWVILGPSVFVAGLLLGLFPRRLPKTVIHQAAQRIIEESRFRQFGSQISTYMDDSGFGATVKRMFSNKLLMFNLLSIMFIQAASINFALQEETYLQSRFLLPFSESDGLVQEWNARFVAYFLKPPVAAVSVLIGGLVISKMKLSGRKITGINIALGIKLLLIYVAFIFIKCDVGPIATVTDGKLRQPYCSSQCIQCSPNTFLPVCPEKSQTTYFNPCFAGCTQKVTINNVEFFEGCTCGSDYDQHLNSNLRASQGSCSSNNCWRMLILFQILSISAAGIMGMTLIGKIIITLRSVLPQDKGMSLAFESMIVGLFAYIPVNLAYAVVTRSTCILWEWNYKKCLLRETPLHGNIISILTASLILIGIIFDILVFIFIKGLNIYNCKVTDLNYTPSLYSLVAREDTANIQNAPSLQDTATPSNKTFSPLQPSRPAPNPEITVFRNPSSVTSSSGGENSLGPVNGVEYAQVVFPPDKHKADDGTTSPKRMAVRADVPAYHLSDKDVRSQLENLKTFNSSPKTEEEMPLKLIKTVETDLNEIRPKSPETDF